MSLPSEYYENVRFKKKLEEISKRLKETDQRLEKVESQMADLLTEMEKAKKALWKVLLGGE